MNGRYRHTYLSRLTCNDCGFGQDIVRPHARRRAVGHQKHLWCIHCKERTPHTESVDG